MTSSVSKLQPIEGLSKRQLSKIERLMKREQINKCKIDAKSFKRKASKGSHPLEPQPRKLVATEQTVNEPHSDQKSHSVASLAKVQSSLQQAPQAKKTLVTLKPYNSQFSVDGGQEGLFVYLMNYVMSQKQKQLEAEYQDITFLDNLEGNELEIIEKDPNLVKQMEIQNQLKVQKSKIKVPFDQHHRQILRKIKLKE